jgi:AcrR family transcriptional regulator
MAGSGDLSGMALDSDRERLAVDLPLFGKLKPGPGLAQEEVAADQRRRLHGAMIALVNQSGSSAVRVRPLASAAGVSTATFYRHFANTDDCLVSAYDAVMATALRDAARAQRRESGWRSSLRAGIATLMEGVAGEPRAAGFALVDVFAAGPRARKSIGRAVGELEGLVVASFDSAPTALRPPRHLVAGMTAGVLQVARATTLTGRADELPGLADELSEWMLALPDAEVLSLLMAEGDASARGRREQHPLPAEDMPWNVGAAADDRERILWAAIRLATREGVEALTAPRVRTEARLSKRRFENCFESLDECILEAVEVVVGLASGRARRWSEEAGPWELRVSRFVLALCAQAARNRAEGRLAFLGSFATGRAGLLRREQMIGRTATALRATVPAERRPSSVASEACVAAAWHIAQADVAARRARSLPKVAPLLSYVVLAPIIGARTAASAARVESRL